MLEKLPHLLGETLRSVRPGPERTIFHGPEVGSAAAIIRVTSSAFADGGEIPARYTEDGDALSPPLAWAGVPEDTQAVVLVIEDADSPTPAPLVHTIVWNLPGQDGELGEGDLPSDGGPDDEIAMGKNSFLGAEYLPPDPPPGHGPHRYLFQVFALDAALDFGGHPGRGALVKAMQGHVIARGVLTGTFERA